MRLLPRQQLRRYTAHLSNNRMKPKVRSRHSKDLDSERNLLSFAVQEPKLHELWNRLHVIVDWAKTCRIVATYAKRIKLEFNEC